MLKCNKCNQKMIQKGRVFRCCCGVQVVKKDASGILISEKAIPEEYIVLETPEGIYVSSPVRSISC